MTEEELKLRQQIADILINLNQQGIEGIQYKIVFGYIDDIFTFLREAGFLTPDMVKGLMFEVQAKKCSQCPKNRDYEWECEMQHRKEHST
jgi:hypothetical protein